MSEALPLDALQVTHPIDVPVKTSWGARQMFDSISYSKGASVIRMLSHHLGSDVFLRGIDVYLKQHAFGTATTGDLFAALEETSKRNVAQFMDPWIRQSGFPSVEKTGIAYSQSRFLSLPTAVPDGQEAVWHIPLNVKWPTQTELVVMTAKQEVLCKQSHILMPHESTFCHVKYSTEDLQTLLDSQRTLSSDTMVALIRDLRSLTVAGEKFVSDLLRFCSSLQSQQDVFVLGEMMKCVDMLESTFSHNERIRGGLLAYRNSLIEQREFGVQWNIASPDYLAMEYQRMCLQVLLASNDKDTIHSVEQRYSDWLAGADTFTPSFRGSVLGYAVSKHGQSAYEQVKARYMADTSVDGKEVCLTALGRVKEPQLVQDFLDFLFSDQMTLQNIHLAFSALGNNEHSRGLLWKYIKRNWKRVYGRLSKSAVVLSWCIEMGLSHFNDLETEREIASFYADKDTSHFRQSLSVALECIKRNATFKQRSEGETLEWLERNSYI